MVEKCPGYILKRSCMPDKPQSHAKHKTIIAKKNWKNYSDLEYTFTYHTYFKLIQCSTYY